MRSDQALSLIRDQIAAAAVFRGFAPGAFAATGLLALATATAQSLWPDVLASNAPTYLAVWVCVAFVSAGTIAAAAWRRARRLHADFAPAMFTSAVERFAPAGVAGASLLAVTLRFAPELSWAMPGLWQMFLGLALCGACRSLPQAIHAVAAWYIAAGLAALALSAGGGAPSPWAMGAPFAIGQLLMAALLKRAEARA